MLGRTGDPNSEALLDEYQTFHEMFENRERGTLEFGPHSPETTKILFDREDFFNVDRVELAKRYKVQQRILAEEQNQFTRHI